MKIRLVRDEFSMRLFEIRDGRRDARTDGRKEQQRDMTKLIVVFRNCVKASKNVKD
jgi:hypothetical protein